jgi:hypothetical protein
VSRLDADWQRIQASISNFLDLFDYPTGERSLRDLAIALDGLVQTYFLTSDMEPTEQEKDYERHIDEAEFAAHAQECFPELGFYWMADPEGSPKQEIGGSYAVGDLAEIAGDLTKVREIADRNGLTDAVWDFRFGYQSHWGRHIHELRTYLHALAAW